jgi:hypothetical protein
VATIHLFTGDDQYQLNLTIGQDVQACLQAGPRHGYAAWYALLSVVLEVMADA